MIRTIIVDDERLARLELRQQLAKHPEINVIEEAGSPEEAISKIETEKPDLIFLDIQMPGKNGFELLEELTYVPDVIFVTAYDEYAIKAFEVSALDYILKPVSEERLAEAIKKISEIEPKSEQARLNSVLGESDQVFIKDGEKCWFVPLRDIRMFQSEGNYVRVFFEDFKPMILKSLNNLEDKLDSKLFFRANRKYLINLKWVESIENWFNGGLMATLKGGVKIEISRRQAARFKDLMSL